MDKAFESQVGRNIEVYVDDLVVKSYTEAEMMRDIEETFRTLRKVNMKLNPKKMLVWVNRRSIPRLCNHPRGDKAMSGQNSSGTAITLTTDNQGDLKKCIKKSGFRWTAEAEQAFQQLKQHLSELPLLVAPKQQEELIMYLSKQVLVEVLENKSIKEKEVAAVIEEDGPTWMTQLVDYLKEGVLSGDKKEARKLRLKAHQYELMEGVLYRRSFLTPWLRCVGPLQADYVMREIHEGPLSGRAEEGQIPNSRHGLLHKVDRSKGSGNNHRRTCEEIRMGQYCMPLRYPDKNNLRQRQTKGRTKAWGEGIKARLGEGNKNWVEELPHVLWAYRTMIKLSHGDTPFSLTYETEAVIPTEIEMPTYRTAVVDVVNNDEELRLNLDLLEERRERAAVCETRAKSKMMKYYNARVRGVAFKPGDFVYRSNDASHAIVGGKLGPK
nr:hypothetical protein [Tanacetum cinerariifolium]